MPTYEFDFTGVRKIIMEQGLVRPFPLLESAKMSADRPPDSIVTYDWESLKGRKSLGSARDGGEVLGVYKVGERRPASITRSVKTQFKSMDFDNTPIEKIISDTGAAKLTIEMDEEDEVSMVGVINAAVDAGTVEHDDMTSSHNFISGKTDKELLGYLENILDNLEEGWEIDSIAISRGYESYLRKLYNPWSFTGNAGSVTVTRDFVDPRVENLLKNVKTIRSRLWSNRYGGNKTLATPAFTLGYDMFIYASNKTANPSLMYHKWIEKNETVPMANKTSGNDYLVHERKTCGYVLNRLSCIMIRDAFKP